MNPTSTSLRERPGRLPASFFSQRGLFVQRNFLDSKTCKRLRAEATNSSSQPSKVINGKGLSEIRPEHRPAKQLTVSSPTVLWVEQRLVQVQPQLQEFFHQPTHGFETPEFLVYEPGDFHLPHKDKCIEPARPLYVRARQLTIVIFLNGQGTTSMDSTYGEGALTFYGIFDDPRGKRFGIPLVGEEGLFVAFPSSLTHEVTPVTFGERYCIVSHAY